MWKPLSRRLDDSCWKTTKLILACFSKFQKLYLKPSTSGLALSSVISSISLRNIKSIAFRAEREFFLSLRYSLGVLHAGESHLSPPLFLDLQKKSVPSVSHQEVGLSQSIFSEIFGSMCIQVRRSVGYLIILTIVLHLRCSEISDRGASPKQKQKKKKFF